MKSNKILLTFFSLLLVFSCNSRRNDTYKNVARTEDGLKCNKSRFYFGDISLKNTKTIPFSFKIEDVKKRGTEISTVDVGCDCVHIKSYPKKLTPGTSGEIIGYIDLTNQRGHVSKPIFVSTSSKKTLLLRIVGNVTP